MTSTRSPDAATPCGWNPTGMVATATPAAGSTALTVPSTKFAT
ncbi:hypothetical protein [Orlajensenia flava]|nr:hypothetical protein [Glaciibacter flavus]